jgi:ATP-dependent protease ClpP protease subunit
MPGSYEDNVFHVGDFDDSLERDIVLPLTMEIKNQSKKSNGKIDLYINSMGGYGHLLFHLVELVELAKRHGVTVRTIVMDSAFSAGSMLAITGTPGERYIARTASHLVHYGSIASFESTPEQIERYRKWKNKFFQNNIAHYKKYADIPNLEQHISDDGFFVMAPEALKYKLADKYTDKFDL